MPTRQPKRSIPSMKHFRTILWGCVLGIALVLLGFTGAIGRLSPALAQVNSKPTQQAQAQPLTPQAALERLFKSEGISANWFAPNFLRQISIEQIQQILETIPQQLGPFQAVQPEGSAFRVVFAQGVVPTQISLNRQGQITMLFFQPPQPTVQSLAKSVAAFQNLPGQASVLVRQDNAAKTEVSAALNPDLPLAVGSAFKLAVLKALRDRIAAGQITWQTVIPIQDQLKSLPSGILQDWYPGAGLTIETLAGLMISLSDNTATDHLLDLVGREAAAAIAPRNQPFLATRDLFVLKTATNQDLLRRYQQGDRAARAGVLREAAQRPRPKVTDFPTEPTALDVEWLFSTQELCDLIATVADLPMMGINPGLAKPENWNRIAFKGGSEPGVINLTTQVQAKSGETFCISATWNHQQVLDETQFTLLYSGLLNALAQETFGR